MQLWLSWAQEAEQEMKHGILYQQKCGDMQIHRGGNIFLRNNLWNKFIPKDAPEKDCFRVIGQWVEQDPYFHNRWSSVQES